MDNLFLQEENGEKKGCVLFLNKFEQLFFFLFFQELVAKHQNICFFILIDTFVMLEVLCWSSVLIMRLSTFFLGRLSLKFMQHAGQIQTNKKSLN